jgi:hypothetical protein
MEQPIGESLTLDRFERAREGLWGAPGFQRRNSTITSPGSSFFPQGTWVVETIRTDDDFAIFLQLIDKEGGQRLVLPQKVCQAIYNQQASIMKIRRKVRAQRGAITRRQKREEQPA